MEARHLFKWKLGRTRKGGLGCKPASGCRYFGVEVPTRSERTDARALVMSGGVGVQITIESLGEIIGIGWCAGCVSCS